MGILNSGNTKQKEEESRKQQAPESAKISMIASGVSIEGTIITDGDLRIEGKISGTLVCKAKLVLGASGVIEGNVDAQNAAVAGTIRGTVIVRDMMQIQETGRIEGDLVAVKLASQIGGGISGNIKTGQQAVDHIKAQPPLDKLIAQARQNRVVEPANRPTTIPEPTTVRPVVTAESTPQV